MELLLRSLFLRARNSGRADSWIWRGWLFSALRCVGTQLEDSKSSMAEASEGSFTGAFAGWLGPLPGLLAGATPWGLGFFTTWWLSPKGCRKRNREIERENQEESLWSFYGLESLEALLPAFYWWRQLQSPPGFWKTETLSPCSSVDITHVVRRACGMGDTPMWPSLENIISYSPIYSLSLFQGHHRSQGQVMIFRCPLFLCMHR